MRAVSSSLFFSFCFAALAAGRISTTGPVSYVVAVIISKELAVQRITAAVRDGWPGVAGQFVEILGMRTIAVVYTIDANIRYKVWLRWAWLGYLDFLAGVA